MKKLVIICSVLFISFNSFAQIQRTPVKLNVEKDSSNTGAGIPAPKNKKRIFEGLGLTKEQLIKLKEIRQEAKAQKEAVENNDAITDEEQRTQLKQIRKNADAAIQNILTAEQWQKFKEERRSNLTNKEAIQ